MKRGWSGDDLGSQAEKRDPRGCPKIGTAAGLTLAAAATWLVLTAAAHTYPHPHTHTDMNTNTHSNFNIFTV